MSEDCKEITTFVCRYRKFKYEVMFFGLMNAPSTFQPMMDYILREEPFARVYLDDVVKFSHSMEQQIEHLNIVFRAIQTAVLKLKISKCEFANLMVK